MSCGYTGCHFGATYPDAICIDGELWDLDSCDEPGGALFSGGDIACPRCRTHAYVEGYMDQHPVSGNARQRRRIRRALIRKVRAWAN